MKSLITFFLIVFFNVSITLAESAKPALVFSDIIIPEAPPVAAVMVAYMNIKNVSSIKQNIIAISSPQFKRVEVHKMAMKNNMMTMKQIKTLSINAKQSIILKSGGVHVMLINPITPLKTGNSVELTFKLSSGELTTITSHVKSIELNNKHH